MTNLFTDSEAAPGTVTGDAGTPVVIADEGTGFVDHSWGTGGPTGLPTDHFSARFTRTVTFAASRYRFTLTSDDGGRLWVDDQRVIDGWGDPPLVPHVVEVLLAAGPHTLRYEYFEAVSGATARLLWEARTAAILASGEALGENQARTSLDGGYTLRYQGDGNLVVTRQDDTCAWSSQTNNTSVGVTVMQGDGNLVVYNGDGTAVWSAGTHGHDGAWLEIANDELVVVTPDGARFVIASLLASEPDAAAAPATGALAAGAVFASTGSLGDPPAPRAAAVGAASPLMLAVAVLCGLFVWRLRQRQGGRWTLCGPQAAGREPRAGWRVRHRQPGLVTPCGPQAASRRPQAGWCVSDHLRRRLPATALLLTALLLVPATARAQTTTQLVEYYHTDALGSVRAVTKQVNGQWQVTRHDFMPFGEEVAPQNPQVDKRLFTGKERDAETGMDYFGARYLRAGIGRFTTVDPAITIEENLLDPQQWNRYAYVRNNPLRWVDPTGETMKVSGDDSERAWILEQARDAVGAKAGRYLDVTWNEKLGSWELSVQGVTMEAFQAMNPVAFDFGMTIAAPMSVTLKVSSEGLPGDNAAYTFDSGQRNGNREPVILLNHPGKDMATAQFGRTVATAWMYEDSKTKTSGQMTWGITLAHELGHAWGINVGWGTARRDENNIALAMAWENRARQLAYGPNTPRRIYHR